MQVLSASETVFYLNMLFYVFIGLWLGNEVSIVYEKQTVSHHFSG